MVLQFSGSLLGGYGIEFYHHCTTSTISLWLLLSYWMQSIFSGSSSVFLSVVIQQLLLILVLSQEVRACPSTLTSFFFFFSLSDLEPILNLCILALYLILGGLRGLKQDFSYQPEI